MNNKSAFKKGDVITCIETLHYCMGQIESDKIAQGEKVTVDEVNNKKQTITVMEHADRYGPWPMSNFKPARKNK